MTIPTESINLDAQFLREFAKRTCGNQSPDFARLLQIAQHIESMDEKLASRLTGELSFEQGLIEGQRRAMLRSNLVDSRKLRVRDGKLIEDALAQTSPKVIPIGQRAPQAPKVIVAPAKGVPARRGFRLEDL